MPQYQFRSSPIRIDRLSDQAAYDGLKRLVKETGIGCSKFAIHPVFLQSQFETPFEVPEAEFQTILSHSALEIYYFRLETSAGITIGLRRHLGYDNQPWESFDLLDISPTQQTPFEIVAKVLAAVRTIFPPIDRMAVLEHLSKDQQQYVQQRETSLHRLEAMQDGFFQKLQDFTLKQATEAQTNQSKLEDAFNKRNAELEAKYAELRKTLDDERTAFDEEKRKLDLRDSTAVRRGIRDEMKKVLTQRASTGFALSKHVQDKRTAVFRAYVLLILGIGGVAASFLAVDVTSNFLSPGTIPSPWLIGRQIASIVVLSISVGFFIKWLNAAAQRLADDEFQTRKYELDFERASFVVEWALEWSKEGNEVPQFLIERLSRGLFDSQTTDGGPVTAADAVASALFGSAASAKLKLGDNEIVLDRKGITKLKKDTESTGKDS